LKNDRLSNLVIYPREIKMSNHIYE